MGDAQVEIFEDRNGEFRWRLRSANGEVVAGGEGHRDRADARRAFQDMVDTLDAAWRAVPTSGFGAAVRAFRIVDIDGIDVED